MAKRIAVANQKGGVGKTTTALCIAEVLKREDNRVLLIDLDPQCNSTSTYGAEIEGENTIYDLMNAACATEEAIQHTHSGDIIAGDPLLSEDENKFLTKLGGYNIVNKAISQVEDKYDYVIMDTPPNLGIYMLNALTAASGVVIPMKAEKYAIDGLAKVISTIQDVIENANPKLQIYGVALTAYDTRTSLDRDIWAILPEQGESLGFPVFQTPIRICQAVKDAQAAGVPLFESAPYCNAALDYEKLVEEIIKKGA